MSQKYVDDGEIQDTSVRFNFMGLFLKAFSL